MRPPGWPRGPVQPAFLGVREQHLGDPGLGWRQGGCGVSLLIRWPHFLSKDQDLGHSGARVYAECGCSWEAARAGDSSPSLSLLSPHLSRGLRRNIPTAKKDCFPESSFSLLPKMSNCFVSPFTGIAQATPTFPGRRALPVILFIYF